MPNDTLNILDTINTNISDSLTGAVKESAASFNIDSTYSYQLLTEKATKKPIESNKHCMNFAPIDRVDNLTNTPMLSSILIIILLGILYLIGKNKKSYLFSARNIFSGKKRVTSYNEDTETNSSSILLWIIAILSISIFCIISIFSYEQVVDTLRNPTAILSIVGVISIFLLVKYILFKVAGLIFDMQRNMDSYIESYFTVVVILGILLTPITIGLIYTTTILKGIISVMSVITLAIGLMVLCFRSIKIFFTNTYSLFYIFLYLCGLEILPILLLAKTIILLK